MTIAEFSRDWVPTLQLVVAIIGLASLLLVWRQIKQASQWNRLTTQYNFLNTAFSLQLDKAIYDATGKLGLDLKGRQNPLNPEEIDKLLGDTDAYTVLIAYLNEFENICGAVRAGIADPDVAFGIHSARVLKEFVVYKPFIDKIRARDSNQEVLIEFERVFDDWNKKVARSRQEILKREAAIKDLRGIRAKG